MSRTIRPIGFAPGKENPLPDSQLVINLPPEVTAAVGRVLRETGDAPGKKFGKALGLYMLAPDARKRGKAVGAADSADVLDTEFPAL